ncbi:tigger transposable element-derived protein 1-like [Phyllopteryx taeniolatus]|uniref:tigger transposable element-derived protein 1-like n=1 Tax=Phyllopteryx taeniolatus TaxID=161469 RepID=UPI002AD2BB82|nr:tigger transposable element-derived protein 1-like [Phyllopteryx taeniolatus]XP_061655340.1 tigger transposable element-derived protein 1-like [Phyllopteryx taeniolatus]XP_061655341.1 tigger transposable element-derived protein 1-like [Phyllopteryx taeniolatus]
MAPKGKADSSNGRASKKRKSITMEVKLDIVKRSKRGETPTNIGRVLDLSRSTVATIIKDQDRILEHVKASPHMKSTIISKQNSGLMMEMERLLVLWLEEQHRRRLPVSLVLIQQEAKRLFETLKSEKGEGSEGKSFVASRGWFMRFKARANLHNLRVEGEAVSSANEAGKDFPTALAEIIKEGVNKCCAQQVLGESLFWKPPVNTKVEEEEEEEEARQAVEQDATTPEPKRFTCKSLAAGFLLIEEGLAKFEAEDPDAARYARIFKGVTDHLRCYKEIWEEEKRVSFQSNLERFFKMVERPIPDPVPDPGPSTSTAPLPPAATSSPLKK